ncbi:Aste57867_24244 [Aphanomyces stellatus]|uniref:Aste57867_24244 protein n=1 Tax=Aphanomyces stellatus TaxID=120398 RepID=A0A485LPV4_9STRA|nr:hypothetical protein As57867_024169 [Aphanomyces stellatus]VFU00884.1 Aste57867_24244 [Aphanomyces stellatus]
MTEDTARRRGPALGPRLDPTAAALESNVESLVPTSSSRVLPLGVAELAHMGSHSVVSDDTKQTTQDSSTSSPRRPSSVGIVSAILRRASISRGAFMSHASTDGQQLLPLSQQPPSATTTTNAPVVEDSMLRRASVSLQNAANLIRRPSLVQMAILGQIGGRGGGGGGSNRTLMRSHQLNGSQRSQRSMSRRTEGSMRQSSQRSTRERRSLTTTAMTEETKQQVEVDAAPPADEMGLPDDDNDDDAATHVVPLASDESANGPQVNSSSHRNSRDLSSRRSTSRSSNPFVPGSLAESPGDGSIALSAEGSSRRQSHNRPRGSGPSAVMPHPSIEHMEGFGTNDNDASMRSSHRSSGSVKQSHSKSGGPSETPDASPVTQPRKESRSMAHRASVSIKNMAALMVKPPVNTSELSFRGSNHSLWSAASFRGEHKSSARESDLMPPSTTPETPPSGHRGSRLSMFSTTGNSLSTMMAQIQVLASKPRIVPFAPEAMMDKQTEAASAPVTHRRASAARRSSQEQRRSLSTFGALSSKLISTIKTHAADHRRLSLQSSIDRHNTVLEQYQIRTKKEHAESETLDRTKHPYLISPDAKLYRIWQVILVVIIYYQVVAIPYILAFTTDNGDPSTNQFNLIMSGVFAVDMVLNFFTVIVDPEKGFITDLRVIRNHYLRGWFVLDLLSTVPFDTIVFLAAPDHNSSFKFIGVLKASRLPRLARVLSLVRILQFLRLPHEWKHWLLYSRYSHLIRLATTISGFAYAIHVIACIWYGGIAGPKWIRYIANSYVDPTSANPYMTSYYAMLTTSMGQSNTLFTNAEYAGACCCLIVGLVLMAVIFGDVGDLIANYYEDQNNYRQKMESLLTSMNLMHLPNELQNRINEYYETMYDRYGTLNGDTVVFTQELSKNLSTEVELYLRMGMITRSPMFRLCSPEFVQELVMKLGFQVYLTDDFVVARGEVGYDMYFIQSGACDVIQHVDKQGDEARKRKRVIAKSTGTLLRTLLEGDFFGEIALLMNCKRVVTVKASAFTELCVLSRDVFIEVTGKYVEDHKVIETFIKEKYDPQVLEAAMQMQADPIKAKQKAIRDCLNEITDRLTGIETKLEEMETIEPCEEDASDRAAAAQIQYHQR